MLTRIICPNCGHIGAATAASLPRQLICPQCGHGAFIKSGRPATLSVARDERAALRAAWERYEVPGAK
jgi:DNA-directed RNA polymerase subunit RPC12/RpoP